MNIQTYTYRTATQNELRHRDDCTAETHSSACYERIREIVEITKYYGVDDDGNKITEYFDSPEQVQ